MRLGWRSEPRRRVAALVLVALGSWAALFATIGSTQARSTIRGGASSSCASSSSLFALGVGGTVLSNTSVSVCGTGRIDVSFTGHVSPGCTGGPCEYTGTQVWQPQGGGDLEITAFRIRGRRRLLTTLSIGAAGIAQSAVQRSEPNGHTTACSDSSNGEGNGFFASGADAFLSPAVRGGRLVLNLARNPPALFGTRCAGPLAVDLGAALPSASISLRRITRGGGVIDLRGSHSFAAHGFSGVVRSTLVLHLGRAKISHPSTRSRSGIPRGRRFTDVSVTYRVERLRGGAVATVRTLSDPGGCGPFDACGLSGTITMSSGVARGGSVSLSASGSATRPRRDLLAAVGLSTHGNPSGIGVTGAGEQSLYGTLAANLRQDGECRDQTRLSAAAVQLQSHAGRLLVTLSPVSTQAPDPLRTRCPGPELGQHALALATLPRSALRRRVVTVALHGNAFSDDPYRVRTRSTLMLTLRRVRVRTQTFRVPSPPSP
jgi:hypothetical protein